jgi:hypothetical protein
MPVLQRITDLTGPRRLLLAAGAAAVLGAGGAGVAYAASDGPAPSGGGYAVVETADTAPGTGGGTGGGTADRDCPKDQAGGTAESEQGTL